MTPYHIVVVSDPATKRAVSEGMLGGNAARVQTAPVVAVFAADLQAYLRIDSVIAMERDAGKPAAYLRNMEMDAAVVSSGYGGSAAQNAKRAFFAAASLAAPMPTVNSTEGWAFKGTSMAAQNYMLACSAAGLRTHPMEGLDACRVMRACGIPVTRYTVPMVIATGYALEDAPTQNGAAGGTTAGQQTAPAEGQQKTPLKLTPRPRPSFMVRKDRFEHPYEGIHHYA